MVVLEVLALVGYLHYRQQKKIKKLEAALQNAGISVPEQCNDCRQQRLWQGNGNAGSRDEQQNMAQPTTYYEDEKRPWSTIGGQGYAQTCRISLLGTASSLTDSSAQQTTMTSRTRTKCQLTIHILIFTVSLPSCEVMQVPTCQWDNSEALSCQRRRRSSEIQPDGCFRRRSRKPFSEFFFLVVSR